MTQLNTPYPATAYLTGFLKQAGYEVCQRDLVIELFLSLLTRSGLEKIFQIIEDNYADFEDDELPVAIYNFFLIFLFIVYV